MAARLELAAGEVRSAALCVVALQARPLRLVRAVAPLIGTRPESSGFRDAALAAAALAQKQCHPLANIPGDADYRRAMVPVYVRRTLLAAAERGGPVHHV